MSYNGKIQSSPVAKLEVLADKRYRYTLTAQGEKGMARISGAKNKDLGEFLWLDDKPQPQLFSREHSYSGKSENWQANFDWQQMQVAIKHNKEQLSIKLQADTQDSVSLQFAIKQHILKKQKEFSIPIYNKEKISTKSFRISGTENLQTAIGCLPVVRVERVYKQEGKFQKLWFAPDFAYILVESDSDKNGKRRVQTKLSKLEFAGQEIKTADRCKVSVN